MVLAKTQIRASVEAGNAQREKKIAQLNDFIARFSAWQRAGSPAFRPVELGGYKHSTAIPFWRQSRTKQQSAYGAKFRIQGQISLSRGQHGPDEFNHVPAAGFVGANRSADQFKLFNLPGGARRSPVRASIQPPEEVPRPTEFGAEAAAGGRVSGAAEAVGLAFAGYDGGVLGGRRLARAVERCRAEREVARERAAVVKAYLIRNEKLEVNVALDRENSKPGYRLGRLMAVLERVQGAAQKRQTVVERYYGAASTRPATVFPRLVGLAQHHLAKLKEGLAVHHQRLLGEVMDGVSEFPSTLNLEEQGLFALGYYHQRQDFYKKHEDEPEEPAEAEGAAA